MTKVTTLEKERHVDQADQHGNFYQRANHRSKSDSRVDAKDCHRYRDSQLEIVAGGRERQRRGLGIVCSQPAAQIKADQEHQHEVKQQRDGNPDDVKRYLDDQVAFQAEHDHDRKQQGDQSERADLRDEVFVIPFLAFHSYQKEARQKTGDHGDAEIDEHAFGNFADADMNHTSLQAKQRWQLGDKDPGVDAEEEHLEKAIKGHDPGCIFSVAF